MKKQLMLIAACFLAFAPQSFAQVVKSPSEVTYDLEEGAMTEEQIAQQNEGQLTTVASKKDVAAGVVLGAIAGVILADQLDRQIDSRHGRSDWDRGGRNDRDDWGRGGRHGRDDDWGRGRNPRRPQPRVPAPVQVVCYAQSYRGEVFRTFGFRAQSAQHNAVIKCSQATRSNCRPLGCQIAGR